MYVIVVIVLVATNRNNKNHLFLFARDIHLRKKKKKALLEPYRVAIQLVFWQTGPKRDGRAPGQCAVGNLFARWVVRSVAGQSPAALEGDKLWRVFGKSEPRSQARALAMLPLNGDQPFRCRLAECTDHNVTMKYILR